MNMSYNSNPNIPKVRAQAVKMVRAGYSTREVARHFGYSQSAVVKWCQKIHPEERQFMIILTESSRPHGHPRQLDPAVVRRILGLRAETRRGAEFIHILLGREGIRVSLSSVKRTLVRHELTRHSKWKKRHQSAPRPLPLAPGILVQADTIHIGRKDGNQLYVYTMIDVFSRWAMAMPVERIGAASGAHFAMQAQAEAYFKFSTIQTDHGAEFSKWFTKKLAEQSTEHRYTRIRKPNDNAHIERFNRTIQEECISRLSHNLTHWQQAIPEYLHYYNQERPHMGLNWLTPNEKLEQFFTCK